MTLIYALGWTLLHFLWQGALIAILLAFALAALRPAAARTRCLVSSAALLMMLLLAVATFVKLSLHDSPAPIAGLTGYNERSDDFLPALVWFWFAGVVLLGIRSVRAWLAAKRFSRRGTSQAAGIWETKLHDLATRLAIARPVSLAISTVAEVPAVIGWLRPVVLMPASALSGLSTDQIEALLAHELAHICRNDYLVNLFQTVAETLFFYHPAVWWVNSRIREERENCCDDLAVEVCGNRVEYARALTDLEQLRGATPRLAMAAGGGRLLRRVERLLNVPEQGRRAPIGWTATAGIAATLLIAALAASAVAQSPAAPPVPPVPSAPAAPPTPPVPPTPPAPPEPPAPPAAPDADGLRRNVDLLRQRQQSDMERRKADIEKQDADVREMKAELERRAAQLKQRSQELGQDRQADMQRQKADLEKQNAEMLRMQEELRQSAAAMKERSRAMEPELQRLRDTVDQIQAGLAHRSGAAGPDLNRQLDELYDQVRRLDDAIHRNQPSN